MDRITTSIKSDGPLPLDLSGLLFSGWEAVLETPVDIGFAPHPESGGYTTHRMCIGGTSTVRLSLTITGPQAEELQQRIEAAKKAGEASIR